MNWLKLFDTRRRILIATSRTDGDGRCVVRRYPSQVEHRGPSEVWVRTPAGGSQTARVCDVGEAVEIELGDETGMFSFPAVVKRRAECFHLDCLVLQLEGDPVHRQRRGHVRVPMQAPVTVRHGGMIWSGWLRNLSAGGMLAALDGDVKKLAESIRMGTTVRFDLVPSGGEHGGVAQTPIHGEARVVRTEDPGVYAFDFHNLSESHRQSIVRYVFRRQIELKRRGYEVGTGR